jgi:hypothetical protein
MGCGAKLSRLCAMVYGADCADTTATIAPSSAPQILASSYELNASRLVSLTLSPSVARCSLCLLASPLAVPQRRPLLWPPGAPAPSTSVASSTRPRPSRRRSLPSSCRDSVLRLVSNYYLIFSVFI